MKLFEISSKKNKNGRRHFKAILYRIFPDSCIDEANQAGTMYNQNGITWLREPCEKALPSIKGMSLRCEFADEDRTELLGHGDTDIVDGEPVYEDAVVIGTFTNGYIDDVELEDGTTITACIGEGEIDAQCYHNLVSKLESDIINGDFPNGSIEIMRTEENSGIIYRYGYKAKGRIPQEFVHSGYALLGVAPADDSAKLIELNKKYKEDEKTMNDAEIKSLVSQIVDGLIARSSEIEKYKEECNDRVAKVEDELKSAIEEKNEIATNSQKIQAALDSVQKDFDNLNKEYESLFEERKQLQKALGEAKIRERLVKMEDSISEFSEDEKAYAKEEIDAFKENPETYEINNIVSKIWEGIGKAAKANKTVVSESNASKGDCAEDIFSGVVNAVLTPTDDVNIF